MIRLPSAIYVAPTPVSLYFSCDRLLRSFDIRLFDEHFYRPGEGTLLERTDPMPPAMRDVSLEEAQA